MSGFTKKTIDKYIRNRIKYWIYDFGRNAHLYLKEQLSLSTNEKDKLTDDDKQKIADFQRMIRDNIVVTGGCFTSMLQGDQPNDLDVYLRSRESASLIAWFYLNKMMEKGNLKENSHVPTIEPQNTDDGIHIFIRSQGVSGEQIETDDYKYFEAYPEDAADDFFKEYRKAVAKADLMNEKAYNVAFMTSNAITLSNGIQIIVRFTGDPETIHSNFDFIHATNYWTWEQGVVYNQEALRATLEKRLYYFGSKFPVASIFRLRKFIERGWRISAGEMLKIAYDVSHLNLDDVSVLRDQSLGMDSAYFGDVIAILRKRSDKDIDRTYLFQAIEQAFNMADPQDSFLSNLSDNETDQEDVDLDLNSVD